MRIFFSVGEPSGDLHGANLIAELRRRNPGVECVGYGGPRMAEAGCDLHADLTRLAVMWFLRVIWNLRIFLQLCWQADAYFARQRPDAVVLIDYPGFNWWIAWRAKRRGIPVFYYGAPQLWAWASWRVKKMRKYVDHVLVKLPFEVEWYRQRGCANVHYIGHPYFDEIANRQLDTEFMRQQREAGGPLVAILPGSRRQEVSKNLPWFLRTMIAIHRRRPEVRFAIASFNEKQAELAQQQISEWASEERGTAELPAKLHLEVHVGRTPELIEAAHSCLACSGSVSLELMAHARPSVILYWIDRWAYFVQGFFVNVRYITLVNLLAVNTPLRRRERVYDPDAHDAERAPLPEYLTSQDKSQAMAGHILRWLDDPAVYADRVLWLRALAAEHARPGASARAAEYVLTQLGQLDAARRRAA